jgi:glutamate synthase domain-containing protein 3
MTGGRVVVLGQVGWNFGAGMTGGEAYVLDEQGHLTTRLNAESVSARALDADDLDTLRALLEEHARWTGSVRARALLASWHEAGPRFRKVVPLVALPGQPQPDVAEASASGVAP